MNDVIDKDILNGLACIVVAVGTKSVIEELLEEFPWIRAFMQTYVCKWLVLACLVWINTKNAKMSAIIATSFVAIMHWKRIITAFS